MNVDIGALIIFGVTTLVSIGIILGRVQAMAKELREIKEELFEHQHRDNIRFDKAEARLNEQEVGHQAILTSLQFITAKLDRIEEKVS